MSRLCSKPGCASDAVAWLDLDRATCRVIERASGNDTTIRLCAQHRRRFSVPAGWRIETAPTTVDAAPVVESRDVSPIAPDRGGRSSGRPWFLADQGPEYVDPTPEPASRPRPGTEAGPDSASTGSDDSMSAGSLLRRAFHGPDPLDDRRRRDAEHELAVPGAVASEVDELEPRRAARLVDEYGTAQLPFPPADRTAQAAVS